MKTLKTLGILFATALLAGCAHDTVTPQGDDDNPAGTEDVAVVASLPSIRTRLATDESTLKATWEEDDELAIYAQDGGEMVKGVLNFKEYQGSDKSKASFSGNFFKDISSATTLAAIVQMPNVYCQADYVDNDLHFQDGSMTGEAGATTHDVLLATASYEPAEEAQVSLQFERLFAYLHITLNFDSSISGTVTKMSLGADGLYNDLQLNPTDGTLTKKQEGNITIYPETAPAISSNQVETYVCVYPGLLANGNITAYVGSERYILSLPESITTEAGTITHVSTTTCQKVENDLSGYVRDADGNGIANVVVSDGYTCVQTDANGFYQFDRNSAAKYVFYSVPSAYEVNTQDSDNTALFYAKLADDRLVYNFTLTKLSAAEDSYKLIVMGDPQIGTKSNGIYIDANGTRQTPASDTGTYSNYWRLKTEGMADIEKTIAGLGGGQVYGISMGDNVHNAPSLAMNSREAQGSTSMKVFSVIGNHDQIPTNSGLAAWQEAWGPTDYSFNRGKVHYVVMNDAIPGSYGFTADQVSWLEADLSYVDSDYMVILCIHVPTALGDLTNEDTVISMLGNFANAAIFCGHTHFVYNYLYTSPSNIMEHSHGALCGSIWYTNVNVCGTPNGYYVYEIEGAAITNSYYKPTNMAYADNQIVLHKAGQNFNSYYYSTALSNVSATDGTYVIKVYNYNPLWKVYAYEGTDATAHELTPCTFSGNHYDPYTVGSFMSLSYSATSFYGPDNTYIKLNHLFAYTPTDADAVVTIKATDEYGNTYTANSADNLITDYDYAQHY